MKTFILILNIFIAFAVYMKTKSPVVKSFGELNQRKLITFTESYNWNEEQNLDNIDQRRINARIKTPKRKTKPNSKTVSLGSNNLEQYTVFSRFVFNGKDCTRIPTRFKRLIPSKSIHTKIRNKTKEIKNQIITISRVRRDSEPCFDTGSCKNNIYEDIPVCYCDHFCIFYNDCCHDNKVPLEISKSYMKYLRFKFNYMSCELLIPFLSAESRGYFFVSKCPESTTKIEIKRMCENEKYLVPVTGDDGLSYMNEYCAICHGVNDFLRWNITYIFKTTCRITLNELVNIKHSDELLQLFKIKNCVLHAIPPQGTIAPRVCWTIDDKTFNNARNKTLCMRYQNPVSTFVQDTYTFARNAFCLYNFTKRLNYCAQSWNTSGFGLSLQRMSALFDFNRQIENHNTQQCIATEKEKCRFEAIIGNCELEIYIKILTNGSYGIWVRILGLSQVIIEQLFIPWEIKNKDVDYYVKAINTSRGFPCQDSYDCMVIHLKLFMTINETISLRAVSEFLKGLRIMRWTYIEKDLNSSSDYTISTFDFSNLNVYIPNTAKTFDYIEFRKFTNVVKQQIKAFRGISTTIPNYLEVIGGHTTDENGTYDNNENFKILNISFVFSESFVYSNRTNNFGFKWKGFQIISTYVTMGISTTFLLVTLIIHRYLDLSRNNAGKVSEHFMIVMIFSHVLFMFGFGANDYSKLCFVIGIVSHYVWLSCFAWMTNFTFLLMIAMLKLKQNPNMSTTNLLPGYYYLIGYGVPFLFVIPSTLLDIFSETKIGYASDTCFPSNYPYNIIVFVGPISFSLLINVVALIVAGYVIYKFRQSIENNSSAIETRSYWPVYLRFFLFSGLTWSLGIISEATDQDILRILFIFFAGSHGFSYSVSILISSQVQSRLRSIRERTRSSIETAS